MRKITLLLALIIFSLGYFFPYQNSQTTPVPKLLESAKVIRVIDGDTIVIQTGQKVRYIGINTPGTVAPRLPVQCFGHEASLKNRELVEGKVVSLEKDVSETDKYGRLLRYVYVDNIFVNDYLVREGFAHVSTFPPDVEYQKQFLEAEKEARANKKGLWADNACP
ncbi:MAG: thermonuclease family protein [bacterium]|nr:thermonuclease family protein [bacterium]